MKKKVLVLIVILFVASCTPKPEQIRPYVEQTLAEWPTQTAYPTPTPNPTNTPYPTYTALPTYTKIPTTTPVIKIVTATLTSTPIHTPTQTIPPTATATTTPTLDPLKQSRGDGMYLVGIEIAPGVWDSDGSGDSCYWEVSTATGDIISNHFGLAGGTAYVPATGFQVYFDDCGYWTWLQN
jgi:hypothetical protein